MRGFKVSKELRDAVHQFTDDYEVAADALVAGPHHERIDNAWQGKGGRRIAAQERLLKLKESIGAGDFQILEAVFVLGAGVNALSDDGRGVHKVAVGERISNILRRAAEFYYGVPPQDKVFLAAQRIIEREKSVRCKVQ